MQSPSSSAQQALQALGIRLREIRMNAQLTGRDLGHHCGWHSSKISKIEYARQTPTPEDIRRWCQHSGADDQAPDLIASLHAAEGMFVEWRRMERTGLRLAQESVLPLWQRTRTFRIYSSWLVPGPIQTPAYIEAALRSIMEQRGLPDDIEAAVRVRVDKQNVAHQGDHRFAIVLEESVLRYPIGGNETLAGQLGHLLTVCTLPSVSLGIIPLGTDRSAIWPVEGFWIFDDEQVAVELVSGYLTITQPRDVAMYAQTFARLADQAVYGAPARALIAAAIAATAGPQL